MKNNRSIILVTSLAILLLLGMEALLVARIYRLQEEKFDYRYREILQTGLDLIDRQPGNLGFDDAYQIMEGVSQRLLVFYQSREVDTLIFGQTALRQFHSFLMAEQDIDNYLKEYLQQSREETQFNSYFVITDLALLPDDGSLSLYREQRDTAWSYRDTLLIPDHVLPVYHYTYSGNGFQIGFNYYVDFSNRKMILLRQVAGSLALSAIALFLTGFFFLYTLRNLMEEKKLSQLKTDFINNMTHELKTPLSTISVATSTMENDRVLSDPIKVRQTLEIIKRQNRQLSKQINHLLEISMWEKKQFSLDLQPIEVRQFFDSIIESFKLEHQDKGCNLTLEYDLECEVFPFDELQLTIAVHNLLANACKYNQSTPEIAVHVTCRNSLIIKVSDNGIGISREDQKHIFEKFYRVSTGNIHKVKGLGLGLFYVRQIAEAHGGSVEVASRPGKGSIFTINLPIDGKNQSSVS
ncbi:MAG: HAMP domain-containing histidine kinase [Bacteroidales bacterium]|nr:HAMP domain-containing histidine kinase [Bacteroidales bacterium]